MESKGISWLTENVCSVV